MFLNSWTRALAISSKLIKVSHLYHLLSLIELHIHYANSSKLVSKQKSSPILILSFLLRRYFLNKKNLFSFNFRLVDFGYYFSTSGLSQIEIYLENLFFKRNSKLK